MNPSPIIRRLRDTFTEGESIEYDIRAVLHEARSAWQEIAIYDLVGHGRTLVLDGNIQSAEADEHLYHEALVQPPMLFHGAPPARVLVLGGGEGATLREVLKYDSVERAVMVDLDEAVVTACREHLPRHHQGAFDDSRAEILFLDARRYLEETSERFDVIISDVVDPGEEPAKHLFTREFFDLAKRRLRDGGIFAMQLGPAFPKHFSAGAATVAELGRVFKDVLAGRVFVPVYMSPWGFAVAGDALPSPNETLLARRIQDRLAEPPRSLDASDLGPLFHLPKELREEIAQAQ